LTPCHRGLYESLVDQLEVPKELPDSVKPQGFGQARWPTTRSSMPSGIVGDDAAWLVVSFLDDGRDHERMCH